MFGAEHGLRLQDDVVPYQVAGLSSAVFLNDFSQVFWGDVEAVGIVVHLAVLAVVLAHQGDVFLEDLLGPALLFLGLGGDVTHEQAGHGDEDALDGHVLELELFPVYPLAEQAVVLDEEFHMGGAEVDGVLPAEQALAEVAVLIGFQEVDGVFLGDAEDEQAAAGAGGVLGDDGAGDQDVDVARVNGVFFQVGTYLYLSLAADGYQGEP